MVSVLVLALGCLALAVRGQDAGAPLVPDGEISVEASNPIGFQLLTGGRQFPVYNIPAAGQPLKQLPTVRDYFQLELVPNQITVRCGS